MKTLKKSVFVLWMVMFCFVAVPEKAQALSYRTGGLAGIGVMLIAISGIILTAIDKHAYCPPTLDNYTLVEGDSETKRPCNAGRGVATICTDTQKVCLDAANTSHVILDPAPTELNSNTDELRAVSHGFFYTALGFLGAAGLSVVYEKYGKRSAESRRLLSGTAGTEQL